jgi:tetratricopeptide (TPR) repeat protein
VRRLVVRTLLATVLTGSILGVCGCQYFSTDYQITYGLNHYQMGLFDIAIPPLMSAAKSLEGKDPPDPRLVDVLIALGTMAMSEKRNDLATDFFPKALKAAEKLSPPDTRRLRNALVNLGMFYSDNDRAADAIPILERAAVISEKFPPSEREFYAIDLDNIASAHQNLKQWAEALELEQKSLEVANPLTAGKYLASTKGTILNNLGRSYLEIGRNAEAEANFKQAIAVLSAGPNVEPWRIRTAQDSYADLLRRTGREKYGGPIERAPQQSGPADRPKPAGTTGG